MYKFWSNILKAKIFLQLRSLELIHDQQRIQYLKVSKKKQFFSPEIEIICHEKVPKKSLSDKSIIKIPIVKRFPSQYPVFTDPTRQISNVKHPSLDSFKTYLRLNWSVVPWTWLMYQVYNSFQSTCLLTSQISKGKTCLCDVIQKVKQICVTSFKR